MGVDVCVGTCVGQVVLSLCVCMLLQYDRAEEGEVQQPSLSAVVAFSVLLSVKRGMIQCFDDTSSAQLL